MQVEYKIRHFQFFSHFYTGTYLGKVQDIGIHAHSHSRVQFRKAILDGYCLIGSYRSVKTMYINQCAT